MLGAGTFAFSGSITLPNIKWALLYCVLPATLRAMGIRVFSVVSGHIRGSPTLCRCRSYIVQ